MNYKWSRPLFLLLPCCLLCTAAKGQQWQDTLTEIQIKEYKRDSLADVRHQFTAGQQVQQIEQEYKKLYQTQSVANLLAQQTPVFIKSYGINGMATLSFRGASAAQSAVLWNGVPILNPALGVADISLLNTGLFDDISLQYGSSSALFGSGNVGGALLLNNNAPLFDGQKSLAATLGAGSFGRKDAAVKAGFENKKWRIGFNSFYQQAKNNFSYVDHQQQEKKLDNAQLQSAGVLLSADYNLGKTNTAERNEIISAQLWLQAYDREIPPAFFEQSSVKRQRDASLRSLLSWQKTTAQNYFYAKGSYNREYLRYEDGAVLPDNKNTVAQYYQELGWRRRIDRAAAKTENANLDGHYLLIFVPLQYSVATGNNISNAESQFRTALVAAYNIQAFGQRLKANVTARQEWVNGQTVPLLPGIGATYRLFGHGQEQSGAHIAFDLRANIQRTYRIPTLNELYYFPGGNADLKPEQGWNEDAGYAFHYDVTTADGMRKRWKLTHETSIFNRNIKDWIYWLGNVIWTPYNIAEVHSRGLETDNKLEYQPGKIKFHLSVKWAYVLSTTVSSYLPGDGSTGKQIPYTPRYNGQGNLGLTAGSLFVNYNHTYTGYRFVTVDESQYLKPFQTGNLQAMYTFTGKRYTIGLGGQVQNIWNVEYQVVNARPMPGRYFLLNLRVGWHGG